MTDEQAQLVFYGQVLSGFDAPAVRRSLGEHLQLDSARLEHLFSGQRVVLKRAVEPDRAARHVKQFARLGARLHVESAGAAPARAAAPGTAAAPSRPRPAAQPTAQVKATSPAPPAPPAPGAPAALAEPTRPAPAALAAAPALAAIAAVATAPTARPAATLQPAAAPSTMPGGLSLVPLAGEQPAPDETITCPNCGEVQPKAVFCRLCVTNMPMGLAARDETPAMARSERSGSLPVRRPAAAEGDALAGTGSTPSLLGFGFRGRMARAPYAAASSVSLLVGFLVVLWLASAPGTARLLVTGAAWLVLCVYGLRLCVLRWHDCNRSGWWSLLLAVPVLGWLAALVLAVLHGTDGDNDYGPPPEAGNAPLLLGVAAAATLAVAVGVQPALARLGADKAGDPGGAPALPPLSAEAAQILGTEYATAPGHKAFAASGAAWGWKGGMASAEEAITAALAYCEANRAVDAQPCDLVSIDGVDAPGLQR